MRVGLIPAHWPRTSTARGILFAFVTDFSLAENFHVVTQHHCAVLLNKDTFEYDISCTPFQIPCSRALRDVAC